MLNYLLDIIFPQNQCCLCRRQGNYNSRQAWCANCDNMLIMLGEMPICKECGKYLVNNNEICAECKESPPLFNIARSVGPYEEPYRVTIKLLKFMEQKHLTHKMGIMMAEVVKKEEKFWPIDIIIPVPISKGNLKLRGFNQAELLAAKISKILKKKMDSKILIRIKETPSQRELSRAEREKNLLFAFEIKDKSKICRKNILLVDDVYTTGSTIRECTRVMLEAEASRVSVITWSSGRGF